MKRSQIHGDGDQWLTEFVDAADAAVCGYEKYLNDELNHLELARIMKLLKSYIPLGLTADQEE